MTNQMSTNRRCSVKAANLFKIPFCLINTLILLRNKNIHLVHSDHPTDTFYLAICSRILNIPLIWHARVMFSSRLDHLNLLLATRVIGVSKAVSARFLVSHKIPPKYVTIYNGVDCDKFKPQKGSYLREELGLGQNIKVIATIGQITPEKGIEDFVESAKRVFAEDNTCRFLIAGTGHDLFLKRIKKKIEDYGLRDHMHLLGFRTDIVNILNGIDLFVLSSRPYVEGLPRVVIEAMSCGKPVVGTNVHGINEEVEDGVTGLLVPPEDPGSLAKAILTLIEDGKKSKKMGAAGRERVKNSFSIESNVTEVQKIYNEVIEV